MPKSVRARLEKIHIGLRVPLNENVPEVSDAIVCLRKTPTHISTLKSLTTARLRPSTAFYLS